MSARSEFSVQEAVARFFPTGVQNDRDQADRFIKWLQSCGYEIVPIHGSSLVPDPNEGERLPSITHSR